MNQSTLQELIKPELEKNGEKIWSNYFMIFFIATAILILTIPIIAYLSQPFGKALAIANTAIAGAGLIIILGRINLLLRARRNRKILTALKNDSKKVDENTRALYHALLEQKRRVHIAGQNLLIERQQLLNKERRFYEAINI